MTITVNHGFVCAIADSAADLAAGKVCQQAHWNAAHVVVGAVEYLTTDLNLYVRPDGNDSNTGLADTAGSAFLTIQRAANECLRYVGREFYDAGIVVNIAAGSYSEYVAFGGARTASGRSILVNATGASISGGFSAYGVAIEVSGLTVEDGVIGSYANAFVRLQGCNLVRSYLEASSEGGIFADECTFSGNTYFAVYAYWSGRISLGITTFSSVPAYSEATAWCASGGLIQLTDTITGTATGKRFNVITNGIVEGAAFGLDGLPGDVDGTVASGGQYFYDSGVLPPDGAGTYVEKSGDTMNGPLLIDNGTLTANEPAQEIAQEWNNSSIKFVAAKVDITDTASLAGSAYQTWGAGSAEAFGFYKYGSMVTIGGGLNANGGPGDGFMYDAGLVVFGNNSNPPSGSTARAFVVRSPNILFNQNGVLQFGDNWSTYVGDVGIGRNAAGVLEVNSTTLGTLRDLIARNAVTPGVTVAALAGAQQGARSFVTDSTVAAAGNFGAVVAGGGANAVPVYHDGTNWRIG